MKQTQRTENPYSNTDSNKRYFTYDYYLRRRFGGKVAKIPLDIGLTCPNIDGSCGTGGCIYCSGRGSGDFAQSPTLSVREQYEITRAALSSKWRTDKCIPYFQAHTNTYASVKFLRERFYEALALDGAVGINIATRADCLPDDVCSLLSELAQQRVLTVELGLQSSSDKTAKLINRGHSFLEFCEGFKRLRTASEKIEICVHIIFGLPDESYDDMMQTVRDVAMLHPEQVKIHLLHVIKGTALADMYERGEYTPMTKGDYVRTVADAIELLPPDTVVARVTGDGLGADLLAPDWSRKKVAVINDIDKLLYERNSYQGIRYEKSI